jgi:glycosyltransferase involved in cell wall biosynthesis
MAEDVHFKKSDGAYSIASKLLRTNLSDLASCGAKPLYYMLGFSQNNNLNKNFVKEFCRGLKDVSDEFLQEIYRSSSCLIVASHAEGFCLPLIEAAQFDLPVIARDIPVTDVMSYFDVTKQTVYNWFYGISRPSLQHSRMIDSFFQSLSKGSGGN